VTSSVVKIPKEKSFISRNVYRPLSTPNIPLPFGLRSVGHCKAKRGWQDAPYKKTFVQLFWIIEGSAEFVFCEQKIMLRAGESFVYYPNHTHLITAKSDFLEYRWVTLDGEYAEQIVRSFGIVEKPLVIGVCPVSDFELLETDILDATPFGQAKCSEKAFSLLSKFAGIEKIHQHSPVIEDCLLIIDKNLHLSDLNVNKLSKDLKIHRSQLTRQFKKELGLSPVEYLISRRIQKGLNLLEESRLTIKEIASKCGYQQPDYFAKAIRKMTGLRPGQIKKK